MFAYSEKSIQVSVYLLLFPIADIGRFDQQRLYDVRIP